jgi:hypothetical protein
MSYEHNSDNKNEKNYGNYESDFESDIKSESSLQFSFLKDEPNSPTQNELIQHNLLHLKRQEKLQRIPMIRNFLTKLQFAKDEV